MTYASMAMTKWLNFNFISTAYKNFANYWAHRKQVNTTIKELSSLSDRELNDMGISRGMIRSIAEGVANV